MTGSKFSELMTQKMHKAGSKVFTLETSKCFPETCYIEETTNTLLTLTLPFPLK